MQNPDLYKKTRNRESSIKSPSALRSNSVGIKSNNNDILSDEEIVDINNHNDTCDLHNEMKIMQNDIFSQIKAITDKSRCIDIFQKTKIYKFRMYPQQPLSDMMTYNNVFKKRQKLI